jgi:hypothetical protein
MYRYMQKNVSNVQAEQNGTENVPIMHHHNQNGNIVMACQPCSGMHSPHSNKPSPCIYIECTTSKMSSQTGTGIGINSIAEKKKVCIAPRAPLRATHRIKETEAWYPQAPVIHGTRNPRQRPPIHLQNGKQTNPEQTVTPAEWV